MRLIAQRKLIRLYYLLFPYLATFKNSYKHNLQYMATIMRKKAGRLAKALDRYEFIRRMRCIETGLAARRVAWELDLPRTKKVRPLTEEIANLKKHSPGIAAVYEAAARKEIEGYKESEWGFSLLKKARVVRRAGRRAVYEHLGIGLGELSAHIREKLPKAEPLIDCDVLFSLVAYGRLKDRVIEMAGAAEGRFLVERIFASSDVYRVTIGGNKRAYIKGASIKPDIFAARYLKRRGVITPKMKNVDYRIPGLGRSEYGVMGDIAWGEGVRRAVSLRALARDERMARLVLDNFDGFCSMLGEVFETCRKLGIQDRHDRNLYVIEREDGSLGIGAIDLDFVACYSTQKETQIAFSGQIYRILESVYFAIHYGREVREEPGKIMDTLREREVRLDSWIRRNELLKQILPPFSQGARSVHEHFLETENQELVKAWLKEHNGKPIGWGLGSDRVHKRIEETQEAFVNGKKRKMALAGPDRGRVKLSWKDAWKSGFLEHVGAGPDAFWQSTFERWNWMVFDWIRKAPNGKLRPVSTISY